MNDEPPQEEAVSTNGRMIAQRTASGCLKKNQRWKRSLAFEEAMDGQISNVVRDQGKYLHFNCLYTAITFTYFNTIQVAGALTFQGISCTFAYSSNFKIKLLDLYCICS